MGRRKKVRVTISWEKMKEVLEKTREREIEEVRKILESPSPLWELAKKENREGDEKNEVSR